MLWLWGLLFCLQTREIHLGNPRPVSPPKFAVSNEVATFREEAWLCRLEPMNPPEFKRYLLEKGIAETLIDDKAMAPALKRLAVFHVTFENLGTESLMFNPGQTMLRAAKGVVGTQLDMAFFLPEFQPGAKPRMEAFARIFAHGTVTIPPGETRDQLVVFRPIRQKFPRRVLLEINRVYYGIAVSSITCQFEIRYSKE